MTKNQTIIGRVVKGKKLGRAIGYPTANIELDLSPNIECGVYLVSVYFDGLSLFGVANFGLRPTINSVEKPILETYIFDFSGDLYGKEIKVEFLNFLRTEQTFNSIEELKDKIKIDVDNALLLINKL